MTTLDPAKWLAVGSSDSLRLLSPIKRHKTMKVGGTCGAVVAQGVLIRNADHCAAGDGDSFSALVARNSRDDASLNLDLFREFEGGPFG